MKPLAVSEALKKLTIVREKFRGTIVRDYEPKAKDCLTCGEQGVCCTDAHFVNVRVTSLEAEAISDALSKLPESQIARVAERCSSALEWIDAAERSGNEVPTYPCPLFEPGTGCLVHTAAKPLPCINHACYESAADLPPDELLESAEREVALLNNRTYGFGWTLKEIPLWLKRSGGTTSDESAED